MTDRRKPNETTRRGRPFEKGNPGRPRGARNKVTRAIEVLLNGEAEALTRKAVEMALEGDTTALRLCLERLVPSRKDGPVQCDLPVLEGASDAPKALGAVLGSVANGEITPSEGQVLSAMIETFRRTLETEDLDRRLALIEQQLSAEK